VVTEVAKKDIRFVYLEDYVSSLLITNVLHLQTNEVCGPLFSFYFFNVHSRNCSNS